MKRPKYLLDCDAVQDALNEAGSDGLTISELAQKTGRNYSAIQQATIRLRNASRIAYERQGRGMRFYPL